MTLGKQAPYSSRTSDLGGLAKAHWLLSQIFVVCNVAGERVTWRPAAINAARSPAVALLTWHWPTARFRSQPPRASQSEQLFE